MLPDRLGIIVATAPEAAWVRALLQERQSYRSTAGPYWQGLLHTYPVILLRCGMGPERALQGATWLLQHGALKGVLSVGFAGGLCPALATGDAILPTRLLCWPALPSSVAQSVEPTWQRWAIEAATQEKLEGRVGALVSSAVVIQRASEKQRLGRQTAAIAVDMESYVLGQVARSAGLPFFPLRTVFDTATEDCLLPPRVIMTASGALRPCSLGLFLARHPCLLRYLPAMQRQARCAGQALQQWLSAFVRRLQEA